MLSGILGRATAGVERATARAAGRGATNAATRGTAQAAQTAGNEVAQTATRGTAQAAEQGTAQVAKGTTQAAETAGNAATQGTAQAAETAGNAATQGAAQAAEQGVAQAAQQGTAQAANSAAKAGPYRNPSFGDYMNTLFGSGIYGKWGAGPMLQWLGKKLGAKGVSRAVKVKPNGEKVMQWVPLDPSKTANEGFLQTIGQNLASYGHKGMRSVHRSEAVINRHAGDLIKSERMLDRARGRFIKYGPTGAIGGVGLAVGAPMVADATLGKDNLISHGLHAAGDAASLPAQYLNPVGLAITGATSLGSKGADYIQQRTADATRAAVHEATQKQLDQIHSMGRLGFMYGAVNPDAWLMDASKATHNAVDKEFFSQYMRNPNGSRVQ